MNQIGFIIGESFFYWTSILMSLAIAVTICGFLAFYLGEDHSVAAGATVVPLGFALSLFLSRLLHWYCRPYNYGSFQQALTDYSQGDYALAGVFAGCFLAALIVRILKLSRNLPRMLDCMALAGSLGISLGRLACLYSASDRGLLVQSNPGFPWVCTMINAVSGQEEYRLATFMLQAMITGVIFLVLLMVYLVEQRKKNRVDGDICLLFLLCHGAAQVILDSTRYDSLFFRSNGFVSIVQVLGAVAIGLAVILFSIRLVRKQGWKKGYLVLWLVIAALLGVGGYMEYHVQRHAAEAVFAYSVMAACLLGLVLVGMSIRVCANRPKAKFSK